MVHLPSRRLSLPLLTLAVLGLGGAAPAAPSQDVLTNAADVKRLTPEEAGKELPVKLRGVVTDTTSPPNSQAMFLADETDAVYVALLRRRLDKIRPGDWVEVSGITGRGQFAPIVVAGQFRRVGTGPLPLPKKLTADEILSGCADAQLIEITGVVRSVKATDAGQNLPRWRIKLAIEGGELTANVRATELPPEIQPDARIRLQGICVYQVNEDRQLVRPFISIRNAGDILVEENAPDHPFDAEPHPIISLRQFEPDRRPGRRVLVEGVVMYHKPGQALWIRDDSGALKAVSAEEAPLNIGDRVALLGFPDYKDRSSVLVDAVYRRIEQDAPPAPVSVDRAEEVFGHWNDLVTFEAELVDMQELLGSWHFTMKAGERQFTCLLDRGYEGAPSPLLKPRCRVRLTGICLVELSDAIPFGGGLWHPQSVQSFWIRVRNFDDLAVIQAAPWWTVRKVIILLGCLVVALVLFLGAMSLQSRRRDQRLERERVEAEIEFSAILKERNRVAREIHDTLAQGLTATSVQLKLARLKAASHPGLLENHLESAETLVSQSLEQARRSIWSMHSQVLDVKDLGSALQGILDQMTRGQEVEAKLTTVGEPRRLAPVVENDLLHIGQEAITNAIRHARAQTLQVTLEFRPTEVRLTVKDDGRGFDPASSSSGKGGFGLLGMRERAREMQGELKIESTPGQGSMVAVAVATASTTRAGQLNRARAAFT